MSVQAMSRVLDHSKAKTAARMILLLIANHETEHRGAFPKLETLAREANMQVRQVQRHIRYLKELGELDILEGIGPHGTNIYRVVLGGVIHDTPGVIDGPSMTPPLERKELVVSSSGSKTSLDSSSAIEFETWWQGYPRKVGKGAARKAFVAALRKTDCGQLLEARDQYAASVRGQDPKFIAHPATWLSAERWEDEAPSAVVVEPEIYIATEQNEDDYAAFLAEVEKQRWSKRGGEAARASA